MREWTEKHIEAICLRVIKRYLASQTFLSFIDLIISNKKDEETEEGGTTNETE